MKEIEDYINENDWRIKENANTRFSISGLKSYISSTYLAKDSLSKLPTKIRNAHKNGEIHIHDLDGSLYSPYCYGADLQQLMLEGLKNPVGSMSKPAKHLDSMVDHMVNYLYMSQNEFNGAQAFSNVDTLLAGYVVDKDYDYVKQCLQRLIYNISYPLRSAFQTPFVNFSFDLIPPKHMKNEPIINAGKIIEHLSYNDLQTEMDMINRAFLEIMITGDSQGKPFTFPIPTYGITSELLKKDDEVMNLLWQLTAKFGNPNFMNYIKSGANPSDVRSQCCRLRLDIAKTKARAQARGLWNMGNKTGSLGVVTINLNHASKDGYDHFIENIDEYYDLAVEELLIKRNYIYEGFNKGLLPFTACYLPKKDPFTTFFSTVGIHAMNEACINMFDSTIEFNQDVTIEMLKYLNHRIEETSKETDILFNLEQTPCEGTTRRFANLDKKFGLPTQGKDIPFLTNSTHSPVNTIFDWIPMVNIQEKFNEFYSGGTIVHGFTGENMSSEYVSNFVKDMSKNTTIPYYNLTPTYSLCVDHGRFNGKVEKCPTCKKMTYIYSRVVGYLQPIQTWNDAKQEEFKNRKEYNI